MIAGGLNSSIFMDVMFCDQLNSSVGMSIDEGVRSSNYINFVTTRQSKRIEVLECYGGARFRGLEHVKIGVGIAFNVRL